jgi:hypothetical protein
LKLKSTPFINQYFKIESASMLNAFKVSILNGEDHCQLHTGDVMRLKITFSVIVGHRLQVWFQGPWKASHYGPSTSVNWWAVAVL